MVGIRTQPVREYTASRSPADDNEVVVVFAVTAIVVGARVSGDAGLLALRASRRSQSKRKVGAWSRGDQASKSRR